MTLEWIIERLKINGKGTKQEVLQALENATDKELYELKRSVETKIAKLALENYYKNKRGEKRC